MRDGLAVGPQHPSVTREALADFRSKRPDCVLALWTDIEARLVLLVDSDLRYPQESLDALSNLASHVLSFQSNDAEAAPDSVVFAERTGNRLFLRDANMQSHALICTSAPGPDPADLLHAMSTFLSPPKALDLTQ